MRNDFETVEIYRPVRLNHHCGQPCSVRLGVTVNINKQIYGPGNGTREYEHVGISGRRVKIPQTLILLSWERKGRQWNANKVLNWV